ncbi:MULTISPECIES: type II secretion system inner membrane protein GspF [unclassified Polynucleobacter]|jgi:general secretion pathway protein F|uniref:type II secretion system inner membrane protein GspF n=1 Tax=unclassified Polynucleobacter TaxID=2640945 RepID=UPI001C0B44EC|nr:MULTISPECIES: type II secretion system inner membrane protein GspF [unclassified Polynucleobacter]MBU3563859.1 type II secretion system inner membrane protein GspF [Polynucleobacter sp. Tro8-14-1]MBU3641339.1 type II secretion system inner membrane protein GspF [Polynucleobacter sp. Fuers-14]MEA9602211.1 type II secretion system inner membrane protein GspF [Polynucleobacter sp. MG-28-Ekke-A2]
MPRYRFEALTYAGKSERGTIEGDSVRAVRQVLMAKQLVPVTIDLEAEWGKQPFWNKWLSNNKPLSRADLAIITKQVAILVRSGVQIDEALSILADETSQVHVKTVLQSVVSELRAGLPLSRAIAGQPLSFDPLYQGVVGAAEQSGKMGQVLTQLAEFLEKRQALKQKAMGALAYPAMLTGVAFMIVLFLMTYVVPQIARVFQSSKQALPFSTRFILGLSDFLVNWGWLLLVMIVAAIFYSRRALAKEEIRLKVDRALLNLPLLGPLLLGFETARFANTMAMLVSANVPILTALHSARNTLSNSVLKAAIDSTEGRLREGTSLSRALGSQGVFSPILIHLIRSGEASGKLAEMLKYGAENAELESEQKTKIFTSLLEPLLILVMGLMVLGIVMAVMQPILEMNSGVR